MIFRNLLLFTSVVLAFAIAAFGQSVTPTPDGDVIKVETLLMNIPIVVSDRDGRYVGGLNKEDFVIRLDGEDQQIEYFADAEVPVSVAIIIDMSGSTIPNISQIREAAKKFVKELNPNDRAMLVTFDQHSKIEVVTDLTSDHKKLIGKIDSLSHMFAGIRMAETRKLPVFPDMYDAIHRVMKKDLAGVSGRKAMIVLTDGFVVGRTVGGDVFDDMIIEGDVVIYPMMFLTNQHVGPGRDRISSQELYSLTVTKALDDIAKKTGGRLIIAAKGTDFAAAFDAVGDELRKQYILGFYPSKADLSNGGKIALGVKIPGLRTRTKSVMRPNKSSVSK